MKVPFKYTFLQNGGNMGELARNLAWTASPAGDPDSWSQTLRTVVSIILQSKSPMFLFWGEHLIQFFNDAYCDLFGSPDFIQQAFGKPARQEWGADFKDLEKVITTVMNGESVLVDDLIERKNSGKSNVFSSAEYSPVFDERGMPAGVFVQCTETLSSITRKNELEENRQQMLASFNESPVAIAIYLKENIRISLANRFFSELVGRSPEELIGKPFLEALPEMAGQGFEQLIEEVISTRVPFVAYDVEVQIYRRGKMETIYVDLTYQPYKNTEDEVIGVLVVATDVTEKVLSRREVEQSNAKFRSLISEAPFATALYAGEDLIIDLANSAMIQLWGKTDQVLGMPLALALPELEGQPFLDLLQQVRTTGIAYNTNEQSADLNIDGRLQRFWFNFTYKPLFNEEGEVYSILNMAVDITEQVKTRQKIEEAEASYRGAIELAELGTWSVNHSLGDLVYSDRIKTWLGLGDDAGPKSIFRAIHEKDKKRVEQAILNLLSATFGGQFNDEYTLTNQITGQEHIIHAQGKTYFDKQGNPLRTVGTARDVTLQRQHQAALENIVNQRTLELAAANDELGRKNNELFESNELLKQSNEELTQYAYVASHDLQEPLRKIRMFSSMLSNSYGLPPEIASTISKIERSAGRMSALVKDLLEFSQLLKSDLLVRNVNLHEIVLAILTDFELAIEEKSVKIQVSELPMVEGVPQQLTQLFYNLIGNAIKFSQQDRKPLIQISSGIIPGEKITEQFQGLTPATDFHHITVKDNGIGFDPQHREQIFEIFKRLHGHAAFSGTGIGLAICRRIVENHKGRIFAESTPDNGSIFHILLPAISESNL